MEDLGIITLYFNRDERAITETEAKYGKLCHKISYNILGDEHEAEECTNDTYFGVWNAIPPERPHSLGAFVSRVARNIALKRLEYNMASKRCRDTLVSMSELEEVIPDTLNSGSIEDKELGEWISEFLRAEKQTARNVFVRKYWFFDSIAEISERYSFSEAKVKSMLFHTRARLKKYLERKGVSFV